MSPYGTIPKVEKKNMVNQIRNLSLAFDLIQIVMGYESNNIAVKPGLIA